MDLKKLFQPSSIVIVGVSRETKKVGHLVAKNLLQQGFGGDVYFVNPKAKNILKKKVYPSLSAINKPIDLAVLALPADISLFYLDELNRLGIKQIILFAAGFKETGEEGRKKEELLLQKAHEYGMTILGPNCIGYINTKKQINTTFLKHICPTGNVGFISQSGALGSVLVDYFVSHKNLGFSYFISLGNKAIVDEADTLEFLSNDPDTDVIGLYLEDVKDGPKFRTILTEASRKKPVVILKSGTTSEGSKAAVSHTGGLIGNDDVYSAVFEQSGAIRAWDFSHFLNILKIFAYKKAPFNKNILVLSNAGGAGVLLTDEIIHNDLCLVTISEETKKKIAKDFGSKKVTVHNPIDLLGDASAFDYKQAIDETFKEKEIGSVVVLLTPQANTEIKDTAEVVAAAQKTFKKPIYPVFMGGKSVSDVRKLFEIHQMPSFKMFDDVPRTLSAILNRHAVPPLSIASKTALTQLALLGYENDIRDTITSSAKVLNLNESMDVLSHIGIPVEPLYHVSSISELPAMVKKLGFPLVAKISSDTITHKTESKGVVVNIKSLDELFAVYKEFTDKGSNGCLVQKMHSGYEIYLGAMRDPNFGPVIIVGLGGIMTELLKEVNYFVYPFSQELFVEKIVKSKIGRLLQGFRNSHQIDPLKLYDIGMRVGHLFKRFPNISELDINPLILTSDGLRAVDARIVTKSSS